MQYVLSQGVCNTDPENERERAQEIGNPLAEGKPAELETIVET